MKFSNLIISLAILTSYVTMGQEQIKSFDFKKGEVLDIILLSQTENSGELFERYKQTAFPVAFEYGYQPQPGFGISKLTLGTNKTQAFLFGKWESLEKRQGFIDNIVERVPDFHEQRRELFPYFGLNYYEMSQDLNFSVDSSKYNVVTSLWIDNAKNEENTIKNWKNDVIESGGKIIITLENGTSPTGYVYDPTTLFITEWQNEEAFNAFTEEHPLAFYEALRNVHQFVIQ